MRRHVGAKTDMRTGEWLSNTARHHLHMWPQSCEEILLVNVKKWLEKTIRLLTPIKSDSSAVELRTSSVGNVAWNNAFLVWINILLSVVQAVNGEATAQLQHVSSCVRKQEGWRQKRREKEAKTARWGNNFWNYLSNKTSLSAQPVLHLPTMSCLEGKNKITNSLHI